MDISEAKEFLKDNHRAVMATFRKDGGVQMSPILTVVDAEGRLAVSSRETAFKVQNLRRNPRAFVCVMNDGFFGKWAFVEGEVEIVSLPEAMEGLVDYYRRAAGEHENWDEYRDAMTQQRRVLIRVRIERAGPTAAG